MARYFNTVSDEYGRPVPGAEVYVTLTADGSIPALTDDNGLAIVQPILTDGFGVFAFNGTAGLYTLEFRYGGRRRAIEAGVPVGNVDAIYRGPQGLPGATGSAGPKGDTGSKGDKGDPTDAIQSTSTTGRLAEFVDKLGRIFGYFDSVGTFVAHRLKARASLLVGASIIEPSLSTLSSIEAADSNGRVFFRSRNGITKISRAEVATLNGEPAANLQTLLGTLPLSLDSTTREIIVAEGQSLALGEGSSDGVNGTPLVLTTDQPYGNLMFNTGVRYTGGTPSSLVPHIEAVSGVNGETILGGFQAMLMQLLNAYGLPPLDHGLRTIAIAPGQGATALSAFRQGQTLFTRLTTGVTNAKNLASGQVVKMRSIFWLQGESGENAGYAANLVAYAGEVDAAIRPITGQSEPVQFLTYQIDRAMQSQFYVDAARNSGLIQIAAPIYWVPVNGFVGANYDNVHRAAAGYKALGACFAVAWFCNNILKKPWRPLCLSYDARGQLRSRKSGADLILRYDVPHGGSITFDSGNFARSQRGFYLFTSGGVEKPLKDVVIESRNEVRLVGAAPAAGDILRIGYKDPTVTDPQSAAVNLRDRQGDVLAFDDLNKAPIHNWAICQQHTLTSAEVA